MEKQSYSKYRHRALTKAEMLAIIEDWSDEEMEIATVSIIPPEKVDELTDEEDFDDNVIPINEPEDMAECVGTFELDVIEKATGNYRDHDDFEELDALAGVESSAASTSYVVKNSSKRQRIEIAQQTKSYKPLSAFSKPKWVQRRNPEGKFEYRLAPITEPLGSIKNSLVENYKDKTPFELFSLFFDNEVLDMIIRETNIYAQQKNSDFTLDQVTLKRFIGILILSGYHTLPTIRDYWSNNPTLGVPIVKLCMSRDRFWEIKKFIHFSNNDNLDTTDRMAKVRPLYEIINKKFMQFGIWEEQLSIDEQMVPYFGRHPCKMFIRGKPIRFGYKLWCLCSSAGYLYNFLPYSGSADKYNKQIGLGADVVLRLLENVEYPDRHLVYFDNFFTSYYLMCLLSEKKICATGTVRANRIGGAQLKSGRELEKGNHDFRFDTQNSILVCRWQDNSEVTLATNFDQILPMESVKRWKKQKTNKEGKILEPGRYVNFNQPQLIKNYNIGMGGVDLHDNAAQNYYIAMRSKKWYWPLWISTLNSAIVNAWKLDCFIRRYLKKNILTQKDFRVDIAYSLIMTADEKESEESENLEDMEDDDSDVNDSTGFRKDPHPKNIPRFRGKHLIAKIEKNKKWRCKLCHKPSSFLCKRCNVALHTHCFES